MATIGKWEFCLYNEFGDRSSLESSGNSIDVSATSEDIGGCYQFAKCSLIIRNNKTGSVSSKSNESLSQDIAYFSATD